MNVIPKHQKLDYRSSSNLLLGDLYEYPASYKLFVRNGFGDSFKLNRIYLVTIYPTCGIPDHLRYEDGPWNTFALTPYSVIMESGQDFHMFSFICRVSETVDLTVGDVNRAQLFQSIPYDPNLPLIVATNSARWGTVNKENVFVDDEVGKILLSKG